MTHRVELLWFAGCENHEAARALLRDAVAQVAPDAIVVEIEASDRDVAERLRFPGSPTIRIDGTDIEPGFTDPGDYAPRCRLYRTDGGLGGLPDRAWIEAALRH